MLEGFVGNFMRKNCGNVHSRVYDFLRACPEILPDENIDLRFRRN